MKAIVLEGDRKLTYKDVPDPVGPEEWPLIRVDAVGICGSDIPRAFDSGAYHYPLIMGHEFAGTVVSEGDLRGARVAVIPLIPCRNCRACRTLDYAQCENYDYLGSRRDGAFAEFVRAPLENLVTVPDHVSQDHAAMAEPCAVALHGSGKLSVTPGTSAIVFGAGPIGNLTAQWLRIRGASPVALVDVDDKKLDIARGQGFLGISSSNPDPSEAFAGESGRAPDIAVEACGLPLTFKQALSAAGRGGEVLLMGNIKGSLELEETEVSSILRRELTVHGTWNSSFEPRGRDDWTVSLDAMGDGIDLEPLISHRVPLGEGVEVLEAISRRSGFFNKVILHPGGNT